LRSAFVFSSKASTFDQSGPSLLRVRSVFPLVRTSTFGTPTIKRSYADKQQTQPTDDYASPINQKIDPSVLKWKAVSSWEGFPFDPKIVNLAQQLLSLNQIESIQLTKYLQQQTGVPDSFFYGGGPSFTPQAQPAAAAAAPAAADAPKEEPKKEEKTHFELVLTSVTEEGKFKVLKEIRTIKPGMKLMESKAMVDKLPSSVKNMVPKEEAERLVALFKELGGTLEMR